MTNAFDAQAQALLEEHVRRLLNVMGFNQVSVRCSVSQASPSATPANSREDGWLENVALNSYQAPTPAARRSAESEELLIAITAGDEGKLLIGAQGSHLEALQQIVRCIVRRQLERGVHVTVDVNGYRARRQQNLMQLAATAAARAKKSGRTVTLDPMSAADRRVLHTTLAPRTDVRTESMGDEPNRRVVIRPVF